MRSDERVDEALDELIDAITETEEYKKYKKTLKELKIWPELMDKVNEFRSENFRIQTLADDNRIIDEIDAFDERFKGFRSDDRVNDFLRSELAFNRLMQNVYTQIMEGIEYE